MFVLFNFRVNRRDVMGLMMEWRLRYQRSVTKLSTGSCVVLGKDFISKNIVSDIIILS